MRDFVFENKTKIYFGKDQMCHLHEEVARFGKRVLMVYGGGSIKKICPGANVEDGTPIHGAEAANADREAREIAELAK